MDASELLKENLEEGRPCSVIHFDPKTGEVPGKEHYNMENIRFEKYQIESLARALLPAIQAFYATEEGQRIKQQLDQEKAEKEALKGTKKRKGTK